MRSYRVSARNADGMDGLGPVSSEARGVAAPPGAPDAPTGLTATAADAAPGDTTTTIDLEWKAPANAGDSDISGYRIEVCSPAADSPTDFCETESNWADLVADTGTTATEYADTGLGSQETRHYRVSAINDQGAGPPSDTDEATTDDIAGPVPESASVPASGESIAIVFDEALDETASKLPQPARFAVTAADGTVFTVGSVAVDDTTATLTLASGSPTVRTGQALTVVYTDATSSDDEAGVVQDDDGNDAAGFTLGPSETVSVTNDSSQAVGPPGVPRNLEAVSGGEDRIVVSWDAPADSGGRAITGYRVEVSSDDTAFTELVDDHATRVGGRFTFTHTGLSVGAVRWYRVAARNAAGPSGLGAATSSEQGVVDKKGEVALSVASVSVAEDGSATWTVTATADPDEVPADNLSMQVRVTSADGTAAAPGDYEALDETVTFERADFSEETVDGEQRWVARKTGTVTVVDDVTVEPEEAFALAMAIGTGGTGWLAGTDEVEIAIEDDDDWTVTVTADPSTMVEGETREVELAARITRGDGSPPPPRGASWRTRSGSGLRWGAPRPAGARITRSKARRTCARSRRARTRHRGRCASTPPSTGWTTRTRR